MHPTSTPSPQTSNTALSINIEQLLKLDLQHSSRLLELLQQERSTLQQRDSNALAALVEEKDQLIAKLDQSAKLRTQWLQQLGYELNSKSWKALIDQQNSPVIQTLWQKLESTIKECRDNNEINGRLISRSQQTLTKLLNILRGKRASTQLYGRDGNTDNHLQSKCFTQA